MPSRSADEFPASVKNPNGTRAQDGRWYSIIGKHPRQAHYAKWRAADQTFTWQGTSETKLVHASEVDEVLNEVDPEALDPGITYDLL